MGRMCEHCGKKGHSKEECFKIVEPQEQFKHAGNVFKDGREQMQDNPLDNANQSAEGAGA